MEKTLSKKKKSHLPLMLWVLVTTALFLAELYLMLTKPANVVFIIGVAALILIAVCFVVNEILIYIDQKDIEKREQYDNIYKAEKASYILLKKHLEELAKRIDKGGDDENIEEIIHAQKSVARLVVGKTNEGTKALENVLLKKLSETERTVLEHIRENSDEERQDRLFIELNNIEASLNDRLHSLSEKLSGFQEEIERLADHIAKISTEAINEAINNHEEFTKKLETDTILLEEDEELEAFADSTFESEEEVSEPAAEVKAEAVPEPVAEVKTEAPAASNAKMSQDDIEALIAGTIPEPEPEPEPVPEVIKEEKAPMPDLSNPNKVMTPEEIAALLANM